MAGRTTRSLAVLLLIACPGVVLGQLGPPGFSGVWDPNEYWDGWPVDQPFTPEGQALQDAWGPDDDTGLQCIYPLGRILSGMWLLEILQTEGRVTILYEFDNKVRRIYTDGRGLADTFPSLMGQSIGRWEGDTLVVETASLEAGFIRFQGLPYSRDMRLTERYNLAENGTKMMVEYTFDEPNYYREPWTVSRIYARSDLEIRDSDCMVREQLPSVSDE